MQLLWLSDNSLENKQFPWLSHIHWLSGLLPTTTCDVCGREMRYRFQGRISADAEGGSHWPDILNGEHPGPPLVISERVKDAIEKARALGVSFGSIRLRRAKGQPLIDAVSPRYFYLQVSGRIDLDLERTGVPYIEVCRGCGM